MENATTRHHGLVAKLFHWFTPVLLIYGFVTGVEDISQLADPTFFLREIIFALCLGFVFLGRLLWMQRINGPTRLPTNATVWERFLSKITHYGIYAGVFTIVLSGLAIALGYAVPALNGLFVSIMIGIHNISLAATEVLFVFHIIGALWHKVVRKDGVWESMLPIRWNKRAANQP